MKPKLYFGGTVVSHLISNFLLKTICAATLLFSSMLMAQEDTEPPVITSINRATVLEHSVAGQVVYTLTATDNVGVTTFGIGGGSTESNFSMNSATGELTLSVAPDFETTPGYVIPVWVEDAEGNRASKLVYVAVQNDPTDDPEGGYLIKQQWGSVLLGKTFLPLLTYTDSGGLEENYGDDEASTLNFLAQSEETIGVMFVSFDVEGTEDYDYDYLDVSYLDVSGAATEADNRIYRGENPALPTLFSEPGGQLKFYFYSDTSTQYSGWEAYVAASDDGFSTPVIATSAMSIMVAGNSGAEQVIYQAHAIDDVGVTGYVLGGADASHFTVTTEGAVTLTANPDFATKASYAITLSAQDEDGHTSEPIAISLTVNEETLNMDTHTEVELFYTNPITNELQLVSSTPIKSLTLYSMTGQKVLGITPNNNEAVVDISSLSQGIYLMKVHTGTSQKTLKLLKR